MDFDHDNPNDPLLFGQEVPGTAPLEEEEAEEEAEKEENDEDEDEVENQSPTDTEAVEQLTFKESMDEAAPIALERSFSGASHFSGLGSVASVASAMAHGAASIAHGAANVARAGATYVVDPTLATARRAMIRDVDMYSYDVGSEMFEALIGDPDDKMDDIIAGYTANQKRLRKEISRDQKTIKKMNKDLMDLERLAGDHKRKLHACLLRIEERTKSRDRVDERVEKAEKKASDLDTQFAICLDIQKNCIDLYSNATSAEVRSGKFDTEEKWKQASLTMLCRYARELERCKWPQSLYCMHKGDIYISRRKINGQPESTESYRNYLQAVVNYPDRRGIPAPTFANKIPPTRAALPAPAALPDEQGTPATAAVAAAATATETDGLSDYEEMIEDSIDGPMFDTLAKSFGQEPAFKAALKNVLKKRKRKSKSTLVKIDEATKESSSSEEEEPATKRRRVGDKTETDENESG